VRAHGDEFTVRCGEQTYLQLSEVQLEGKRRMSARDFVNGMRVQTAEMVG
jgi:methionyl-tRNA formyltransferase